MRKVAREPCERVLLRNGVFLRYSGQCDNGGEIASERERMLKGDFLLEAVSRRFDEDAVREVRSRDGERAEASEDLKRAHRVSGTEQSRERSMREETHSEEPTESVCFLAGNVHVHSPKTGHQVHL